MAKKQKKLKRVKGKEFFNYKKRRGDRTDGWRVRSSDPMFDLIPHIMPTRNDAQVFFEETIESDALDKFMRQQRRDPASDMPQLSRLIVLMAALVRAVARYPKLNRFCAGKKIYARNELTISMTVKRSMSIDSDETVIKPHFFPNYTLKDVYDALMKELSTTKGDEAEKSSTDDFVSTLTSIPQWMIRAVVRWVNRRDATKGPAKFLKEISPFHTSCFVTDMGSTGIGPVYHHIYNMGTTSVFIAMGKREKKLALDEHGQPQYINTIGLKIVIDERVADGFYYAKAIRYITHLLQNPELLLLPPEEINEDPLC